MQLNELVLLLDKEIEKSNLVVLCGAGISMKEPALLPNAQQLISQMVKRFTGAYSGYFENLSIRPEVLFHIIAKYELTPLYTSLQGALQSEHFNANHLFLAKALAKKCPVITTNFDLLIEEACESLMVAYCKRYSSERNKLNDPQADNSSVPFFKIHGSLDEPQSLFLTINHIYKGLSLASSQLLHQLVAQKTVLVIGYSGFDQLDIMPSLQDCDYQEIIWINHANCDELLETKSSNRFIDELPRLRHLDLSTDVLISSLINPNEHRDFACSLQAPLPSENLHISPLYEAKIAVDILMHQNNYSAVCEVVQAFGSHDDLWLKVEEYTALSSIRQHDEALNKKRIELIEAISALPPQEQLQYASAVVRFAGTHSQRAIVYAAIADAVKKISIDSDHLCEATIEVAYQLLFRHEYEDLESYLDAIYDYAEKTGNILFMARTHIINAAWLYALYGHAENAGISLLKDAQGMLDEAIFLLDRDIFNDRFYLCQALNNNAMVARVLGDQEKALSLYKQTLAYFKEINKNHYTQTLFNIAAVEYDIKHYQEALSYLKQALQQNKEGKRDFLQGNIYRLMGQTISKLPESKGNKKEILQWLNQALDWFSGKGLHDEYMKTEEISTTIQNSYH